MTVTFVNGEVRTYANAAVQEKDGGQVIALYDTMTCRIGVSEFTADTERRILPSSGVNA
jgi:hypothetical protein